MPEPSKPAAKKAPAKATPPPPPVKAPAKAKAELPDHKDDLAALAITHGIPSYEAWAMTVAELTDKLEALRG